MNKSTYTYEISDSDGAEGKTKIRIVNDGHSVYIEINRTRTTEKCVGIKIDNRTAISIIQATMEEQQ